MSANPGIARQQTISEQFDFFSSGVIFCAMLMDEKPFKIADENDKNVFKLPLTHDMMCISDINPIISASTENIIFRCPSSKNSDLKYRHRSIIPSLSRRLRQAIQCLFDFLGPS
jgi:serine/threonine protein kinase